MVDVEGDEPTRTINLVLTNVGKTHAENVLVPFDPPLESADPAIGYDINSSPIWRQQVIPPRKPLPIVLDRGPDRTDTGLPLGFTATVTYESPGVGVLDPGWTLVDEDTPKRTRALERIANSVEKMVGS